MLSVCQHSFSFCPTKNKFWVFVPYTTFIFFGIYVEAIILVHITQTSSEILKTQYLIWLRAMNYMLRNAIRRIHCISWSIRFREYSWKFVKITFMFEPNALNIWMLPQKIIAWTGQGQGQSTYIHWRSTNVLVSAVLSCLDKGGKN